MHHLHSQNHKLKAFHFQKISKIFKGAFFNCNHLQKVHFPSNSDIQIIEEDDFSKSSIEYISLPSSLLEIRGDDWFNETTKIEIISDDQNFDEFEIIEEIQVKSEEDSAFIIENKKTGDKYVKKNSKITLKNRKLNI